MIKVDGVYRMVKTCKKCGKVKTFDKFSKHPNMSDGHRSACKRCSKTYTRAFVLRYAKKKVIQCVDIADKMAEDSDDREYKKACWKVGIAIINQVLK